MPIDYRCAAQYRQGPRHPPRDPKVRLRRAMRRAHVRDIARLVNPFTEEGAVASAVFFALDGIRRSSRMTGLHKRELFQKVLVEQRANMKAIEGRRAKEFALAPPKAEDML